MIVGKDRALMINQTINFPQEFWSLNPTTFNTPARNQIKIWEYFAWAKVQKVPFWEEKYLYMCQKCKCALFLRLAGWNGHPVIRPFIFSSSASPPSTISCLESLTDGQPALNTDYWPNDHHIHQQLFSISVSTSFFGRHLQKVASHKSLTWKATSGYDMAARMCHILIFLFNSWPQGPDRNIFICKKTTTL